MIELPKLSERLVRLHALRWNDLIKAHGFTGDHLTWHESHDRRRKAAKPFDTDILKPRPSESVSVNRFAPTVEYCGAQGERISHEEWRQKQFAAWAARESDPAIIDSIGIAETVALAKARFAGIAGDYLVVWADTNGDSDQFAQWLEGIRHLVGCEVGNLWRQGEWQAAWFERVCRGEVHDRLAVPVDEWKSRAAGLEIQHLENPHLSLRSLLVADGDLNFAVTLEQGEQTIRLLASLEAFESTTTGERKTPTEGFEQRSTQQGTHTAGTDDGGVLPNPGTLANRSGVGTMNITPQQKDLLIAIVDGHHRSGGSEFIFVQSHSSRAGGGGLCWAGCPSISVSAGETDFRQLEHEMLITLAPGTGLTGKPTQRGIETAAALRNQPAPAAATRNPFDDIGEGVIEQKSSWNDLRTVFESYAARYADRAERDAPQEWAHLPPGQWALRGGSPRSERIFKEIAAQASAKLEASGHRDNAEAWKTWLDFMWTEGWYRPEALSSSLGATRPRQLRWREFRRVAEEAGRIQRIDFIFQTSADCCHECADRGTDQTALPVASGGTADHAAPDDGLDLNSEPGRNSAVAAYTTNWNCSEASLARTATVDPADLVKWKKGELPATSDKKARIEKALKKNEPPTPPARPKSGA